MRVRTQKGTSLVEILVVIVIFLVGILAIVQVFPPGLAVLRTSRNNTMAAQLGEAESQRILGRSGQLPEMIVPVTYIQLSGGGVQVKIDPNRLPSDLMPPRDANQPGRIDANGDVLLGGTRLANWQRVSGANLFTRVIGESTVVPAPRQIPGLNGGFGGVYTMAFGPAYFIPTAQGVGVDGVVSVYGNDYVRLNGNREANRPNPFRSREGEFYFVSGDETDDTNFPGEDQIWVAPSSGRKFRISMSFAYDNSTSVNQFDVILQTDFTNGPTVYGVQAGNYWVISLQKLIAQQDIYGNSNFQESGYRYTDFGSLRLQRVYEEIPIGQAFSANDPYEYKVLGTGQDQGGSGFCLGSLLFNPTGYSTRVRSAQSNNEALLARMDYAVFDWRLIKDEFRVPTSEVVAGRLADKPVKLILNSIKTFRGGPDNRQNTGLGLNTPTIAPLGNGLTDDAVVVDIDTGAVILGNLPGNALSGWWMDKSLGNITFHDVDNDPSNGLSVYMSFPTGDPNNPWGARRFVPDVTRR
ncbi:MAG: hypothetical protein JNM34_04195, partial [Chthonomonadaceae bacterium]|nr:hypothetical protein [Chthonomonadaceae bacterium]